MQHRIPTFVLSNKKHKDMKTTFAKSILLGLFAACLASAARAEDAGKENKRAGATVKVLVVGLDKVCSNYFPAPMIAEETGIPEDSIGDTYNRIITDNIIQTNKNKDYTFLSSDIFSEAESLVSGIRLNGENEESYADLSLIDRQSYDCLLDRADADYVLFLNQHYLKWQEKPLHTLFHFVSYSLYDRNRQEVTKGNNYFTCMNLEKSDKLAKASRKSSSKIAAEVIKSISKRKESRL